MNRIKAIRERLQLTQAAFAVGVGCSQGNVSFYENGQEMPPGVATRLIAFAKGKGLVISFDHIYGEAALPGLVVPEAKAA